MRDDTKLVTGDPPKEYDYRRYSDILNRLETFATTLTSAGPIRVNNIYTVNFPTSSTGLKDGQVWNSDGFLIVNSSSNPTTSDIPREEVGTWTPVFKCTTTDPTVVYTMQEGKYVKIGNIITASFVIHYTDFSGGSGGHIGLDGLPFRAVQEAEGGVAIATPLQSVPVNYGGDFRWAVQSISGDIDTIFYYNGTDGAYHNFQPANFAMTAGAMVIRGNVTYIADLNS